MFERLRASSSARWRWPSKAWRLSRPVSSSWVAWWASWRAIRRLSRDVLEDQHGAEDAAVVGADGGAGALDGVAPAVAPFERDALGQAEAPPLLQAVAQQPLDLPLAPGLGQPEDLGQRPAQGLGPLPAGELLGHRVQVLDAALVVRRQDAVADRGQGDLGAAPSRRTARPSAARRPAVVCASRLRRMALSSSMGSFTPPPRAGAPGWRCGCSRRGCPGPWGRSRRT